jgi:transposase
MTTLIDQLVPDELWAIVQPLLPPPPRPWWGGRTRSIPDRNCFAAIIYMARASTPWRLLPAKELGCGSAATVWRRLDQWATAGVFEQLHLDILDRLGEQGRQAHVPRCDGAGDWAGSPAASWSTAPRPSVPLRWRSGWAA